MTADAHETKMVPIPVYLSQYNWKPGMSGNLFHWERGTTCIYKARDGKEYEVIIDSERMAHPDLPDGYVYEAIFADGSGRWAVDADQLTPNHSGQSEIVRGRHELGLT